MDLPPPSYDDATAETKPLTGEYFNEKPPTAGSQIGYHPNTSFVANTQPSAPIETNITIEHVRPATPQVPGLCSTGAAGFCTWCWLSLCCTMPTAYFMGRRLKEQYAWIKYGIPGILSSLSAHSAS